MWGLANVDLHIGYNSRMARTRGYSQPNSVSVPTGNAGPPPNVQLFTSGSGNWDKPTAPTGTTYTRYRARLWGGGGGGGSGRRGAAGTNRWGGGSGQGGNYSEVTGPLSELGATVAYSIGAGGIGGAAVSVDDTNGNAGANGSPTTFGPFAASEGFGGAAGTGSNGLAGNNTNPVLPSVVLMGFRGNIGMNSTTASNQLSQTPSTPEAGLAGGPGGGIDTANTARNGGAAQPGNYGGTTPAGGVVGGASPINGATPGATTGAPGPGGSGGASSASGAAQSGNNGGGIGSGGGGGGASANGTGNSGAGGNGGNGAVEIMVW